MGTKLYVGNLKYEIDTERLRTLFAQHGNVADAIVLSDRETGRSRGFGFVTMASEAEAKKAIEALNGFDLDGRALTVNEARERPEGERRGGGGGYSGGGGGGRGGFGGGRGGRGGRDRY
jgi:RNA recognition motif-containing protein